ncbi:filamentous hemagglutinin N-terminal domain-containing protein [Alkalinema sp. FACHB-956]|uniref:two-partner secretion domain-containing protein n=1 Tax=Alkalinema sp. FACHB-956 TaxID=2692768 RepID=UPI001689ED9F|nr:filamentous hemagglutinin N-terminal domain-containing protein [Alkalinema sp. FACHB-956]MBD2329091.1 filamentous hemagglutinin N-terminal domain-containing protein [Alkalinema sp. FACHB-956]
MKKHSIATVIGLVAGMVVGMESSIAQVSPDGSLPSAVSSPNGLDFTIDGGGRSGGNLFHSFSQFSVPTGGSAVFNNALDVQNIFARVTGGTVSNIDGLIKANGSASLFLINPSGILFGPNASLNIGGSFIGTTASSVKFADGTEFSAVNPSHPPLLTMSAPIGLQMGQNPGAITVQGIGNQLIDITGFGQASPMNSPDGLQAGANQTLALIGGTVNFAGGVASIQGSGHLEVGSVQAGMVGLTATPTGWVGDYSAVSQFNDISLAQDSMLNASGRNGSIQLQGQNISLSEGSALLLQNLVTSQSSGGITVNARGFLSLTGNTSNGELGSLIQSNNFGSGAVGDINVTAANLSLYDGARIFSRTRSQAAGANINIAVQGLSEISGFDSNNPALYSGVATFSAGRGSGGNITISTQDLNVLDSGNIISVAVRSGDTGTIQVNATGQMTIAGYNPLAFGESTLSTFTQGAGNAKDATINTARLLIQGGSSLGSSTVADGAAGSVLVNASESIEIQGKATQGNGIGSISRIISTAEILSPESQAAFGLPAIPSGNSGSLTINTPILRIADGAVVSVRNDGPGIGGNVWINANVISLSNQSSITAAAFSGEGGNIDLQVRDLLLMRQGNSIVATAGGQGNGGNITIDSPIIVGLENSDIVANAFQGRGGNIEITTQGILGLKYRSSLTPENDITASSEFGISGNVRVNTIGTDPNSGLTELPMNTSDPSQKIATGCSSNQGSQFVATGRGGIPKNPNQEAASDRPWHDLRDLSAYRQGQATVAQIPTTQPLLVQASSWQRNADGSISLIAAPRSVIASTIATCSAPFS